MTADKAITPANPMASLPEFFALNGRYVIAPETSTADLAEDTSCLFSVIEEMVLKRTEEKESDPDVGVEWGLLYLVRQARAVFTELYSRMAPLVKAHDDEGGHHE